MSLNPEYKMAVREFHIVSSVSETKLPRAQALIVWETMKEMFRQGLVKEVPPLAEIMKVVPSSIANLLESCSAYDAFLLEQNCSAQFDAVFSVNTCRKAAQSSSLSS
jgi:phosphatidylglycerophosphatase A